MLSVKIVYGPPGSGKTTYVQKRAGTNSMVYDFDLIMAAITNSGVHEINPALIDYVHKLRFDFPAVALANGIETVWIISLHLTDELKALANDFDVYYIKMLTSKEECLKRIKSDPQRDDEERWIQVLNNYYEEVKQRE